MLDLGRATATANAERPRDRQPQGARWHSQTGRLRKVRPLRPARRDELDASSPVRSMLSSAALGPCLLRVGTMIRFLMSFDVRHPWKTAASFPTFGQCLPVLAALLLWPLAPARADWDSGFAADVRRITEVGLAANLAATLLLMITGIIGGRTRTVGAVAVLVTVAGLAFLLASNWIVFLLAAPTAGLLVQVVWSIVLAVLAWRATSRRPAVVPPQ